MDLPLLHQQECLCLCVSGYFLSNMLLKTLVSNTGAPQGAVPSPFRFTPCAAHSLYELA